MIGNDAAIAVGGMQGHFELNVFVPLIARNLLDSIRLLSSASRLLAERCVDGIEANREQCERYAELTLSAATALNPYIGYDRAGEIVKEAAASGRPLREVALEAGVEESVLDEALDYRADGEAARRIGRKPPPRFRQVPLLDLHAVQARRGGSSDPALGWSPPPDTPSSPAPEPFTRRARRGGPGRPASCAIPVASAKTVPAEPAKPTQRVKHAAAAKVNFPHHFGLTNATVARWAGVMRPAVVRAAPSDSARVVTNLETWTSDNTQNVVLVLGGVELPGDVTWYRVRLPILPNNSTGWVRKSVLSDLTRSTRTSTSTCGKLTATLEKERQGRLQDARRPRHLVESDAARPVLRALEARRLRQPVYGPLAFGTSARSPTLTDWPGGGFVGVHGTNQPEILPGYVSHGCIRMPNEAILKLSRLMPVGTPITIH